MSTTTAATTKKKHLTAVLKAADQQIKIAQKHKKKYSNSINRKKLSNQHQY